MRTHEDLVRAFDSIGTETVDPDDMLGRVHAGSAALQNARRRRAAVLSVSAAAALVAIGAIVVPALGNDQNDNGQVATTPTLEQPSPAKRTIEATRAPEESPPAGPAWSPTALDFRLADVPQGYTWDGEPADLIAERADTSVGNQVRTYAFKSASELEGQTLTVTQYSPELSGIPAPAPTGESIAITSASVGPMSVQVIDVDSAERGLYAFFGVAWQTDDGSWFTVDSNAPGDLARQQVLAAAAQVQYGADSLTFPFQVGYVPGGLEVSSSGYSDADSPQAYVSFDVGAPGRNGSAITITAGVRSGVPPGSVPNTTIGPYQAQLFSYEDSAPGRLLMMFDVEGFFIAVGVDDSLDEATLLSIAESIVVLTGAASDLTVWTDQPLG